MKPIHPELLPYTSTERIKAYIRSPGTPDPNWHAAFDEYQERYRLWRNRNDSVQVYELLAAKWTFEIPSEDADPFAWQWRSPPKGKRALGRKYLSTNQAWNALQKQSDSP